METIKITTGKSKSLIHKEVLERGESIEEMVRRCVSNNEPIGAEAPMNYTEKAKGVNPAFDMRTDRQELALEAIDKFQKSEIAKAKAAEEKQNNELTSEITE